MSGPTPTLSETIPDKRTLRLGSNVGNTFSYPKDPDDQAWFAVTFDEPLASVNSPNVAAIDGDGSPLTVGTQTLTTDKQSVALWLIGGTASRDYSVRITVVTQGGDTLNRTVTVPVANL